MIIPREVKLSSLPDDNDSFYKTPRTLKHLLFRGRGRINRRQYLGGNFLIGLSVMAITAFSSFFTQSPIAFGIAFLIGMYCNFQLAIKRCHDLDWHSAWSLLLIVLGPIFWLVLICFPGTSRPNKYGLNVETKSLAHPAHPEQHKSNNI